MSWRSRAALALVVGGVACGSEVDDTGSKPDDVPDTTPPTLLSITPEDGAEGLPADTVVTLRFSEAMDPSTVHGTLATQDLGDVDFEWNDAGDTLTIRPWEPLAYAEGDDPEDTPALRYSVILGSAAKDLAGNELGPGAMVTFSTARRITTHIEHSPKLSAAIYPDRLADIMADTFMVGDNDADECVRSVMSFDLGLLPEDAAIEDAHVETEVYAIVGSPFDLGGAVLLDHVSYDGIEKEADINAAFNASQAPHAQLGPFANADSSVISHKVTAAVLEDWTHREARGGFSQYLLRFADFTDLDKKVDVLVLDYSRTTLKVVYLTP